VEKRYSLLLARSILGATLGELRFHHADRSRNISHYWASQADMGAADRVGAWHNTLEIKLGGRFN
jgi:hypothetical protein